MKFNTLGISLAMLTLAASANGDAKSTTIQFKPEAGFWDREYRMIAQVTLNDQAAGTTSVHTQRETILKSNAGGWTMTSVPGKVEINGLESSLDRSIQEILLSQGFAYRLDNAGKLLSIDGFDDMSGEVNERIPAQDRPAVAQVLNGEAQRWRLKNQWKTEQAWLFGKTVAVGQRFEMSHKMAPPNAPALSFSQVSEVKSIGDDALEISFESTATPVSGANLGQLRSLKITESGTRVYSLKTGLVMAEDATRTVNVTINSPQGPLNQVRKETRLIQLAPK